MITGIRIDKVEAWREKPAEIRGLDINISVDAVKVTGPEVEVNFTYMATYPEATGSLTLKGHLADETQKLLMSYVAEMGTHSGHLPDGVTLSRWDVGPGTMEAELSFVGLPVSPAAKTAPMSLRFKAGFEGDEQRQLAMGIKEKMGAKAKLHTIISLRNISMNGNDASMEIVPAPVGVLRMSGALLSHEDGKMAKEISSGWTADRKLPDAFSELVLNAINFTCGTNGVLVVRPVNLAPPMVPPRIQLGAAGSTKAGTQ
jgi:hypothetical protein